MDFFVAPTIKSVKLWLPKCVNICRIVTTGNVAKMVNAFVMKVGTVPIVVTRLTGLHQALAS